MSQMDYVSSLGPEYRGYSDGLAGNAYAPFFGLPSGVDPMQAADKNRRYSHQDLAQNYMGKENRFMETTILGLAHSDNDWTTTVCMPLEFTNDVTFTWSALHFDRALVDPVAPEGIPRLMQHSREDFSAPSQRHATSMIFERDFMATPDGVRDYGLVLQQARLMVQRTNAYEVIFALMNVRVAEQAWMAANGVTMPQSDIDGRMRLENTTFGMFQKDAAKAPEKLHALFQAHASRKGWAMNMYIFPPQLLMYIKLVPVERTYYSYAGEWGVRTWMKAPPSKGQLCGLPVYEAEMFDMLEAEDRPSLMGTEIVVGEDFIFNDRFASGPQDNRQSKDRSGQIYDEDNDNYAVIEIDCGIKHGHRFDEDGNLADTHYQLAKQQSSRDMFLSENSSGTLRVTEFFGQMEAGNLTRQTIDNVMNSAVSKITAEDRMNVESLVDLHERLAAKNVLFPYADAYNTLVELDDNNDPVRVRPHAESKSVMDTAFSVTAGIESFLKGGFGSWFGLEVCSRLGDDVRTDNDRAIAIKGIASFKKVYQFAFDTFGGDTNPVLDPAKLPHQFKGYVEDEGCCNLWERVVSKGSIYLYLRSSEGDVARLRTTDRAKYYQTLRDTIPSIVEDKATDYALIFERIIEAYNVGIALQLTNEATLVRVLYSLGKIRDGQTMQAVLIAAPQALFKNANRLADGRAFELDDFKAGGFAEYMAGVEIVRPNPEFAGHRFAQTLATPLVCHKGKQIPADYYFADPATGYTSQSSMTGTFDGSLHAELIKSVRVPRKYHAYVDRTEDDHLPDWEEHGRTAITRENMPDGQVDLEDPLHFTDSPPFLANYEDLLRISVPIKRLMRACFIYARVHRTVFEGIIRSDVTIPYGVYLVRPFDTRVMNTVIGMQGGAGGAGMTMFGYPSFLMDEDIYTKTIFGHLSYWSRAVVFKPHLVLKAECCSYGPYLGGCGVEFFSTEDLLSLAASNWIKTVDQKVRGFPSLIAFMVPSHEVRFRNVSSLTGHVEGRADNRRDYSTCDYYTRKFGFNGIRGPAPGMNFYKQTRKNVLTQPGMQRHYNPRTGMFGDEFRGTGHHGPNVQPGCGPARNGEAFQLPPIRAME